QIEHRGHVHRELRELVLRVLIEAAEPVAVRDPVDARHLDQALAVRERQREDERGAVPDHEPRGLGGAERSFEGGDHGAQGAEEEERDRDREDREKGPPLGAEEVRPDEPEVLHGWRTPLSRWCVFSARAAAWGSLVSLGMVLSSSAWWRRSRVRMSAALFASRSRGGTAATRTGG